MERQMASATVSCPSYTYQMVRGSQEDEAGQSEVDLNNILKIINIISIFIWVILFVKAISFFCDAKDYHEMSHSIDSANDFSLSIVFICTVIAIGISIGINILTNIRSRATIPAIVSHVLTLIVTCHFYYFDPFEPIVLFPVFSPRFSLVLSAGVLLVAMIVYLTARRQARHFVAPVHPEFH